MVLFLFSFLDVRIICVNMYLNLSACLKLNYMSVHTYIYVCVHICVYILTTCVVPVVKKEFICLGM